MLNIGKKNGIFDNNGNINVELLGVSISESILMQW